MGGGELGNNSYCDFDGMNRTIEGGVVVVVVVVVVVCVCMCVAPIGARFWKGGK